MKKNKYRQALIDLIGVSITESEVMAGSIKTSYLSAGFGEPLIFLHGAGAGAVTWYPSIGPLSKHFKVIAPDIVGYGESDKPDAPYDRKYFSSWLKEFLKELNITNCHIVGLSQGGAIALQFTLDNSDMVEKLVLVDSGALGAKAPFTSFLGLLWLNSFPSSMANLFYSPYILYDPKNRDSNHAHYSVEVIKSKNGKNAFRNSKGAAVSKMPEELLHRIKNETLIIWGENDRLFPVNYGKAAVKLIPNGKFLSIQSAGHLPHIDQPVAFNTAVLDFLQ